MSLLSAMRTARLNEEEKNILLRQDPATETDGGFQKLLVTLQYLVDEKSGAIELPEVLLERIPRYAFAWRKFRTLILVCTTISDSWYEPNLEWFESESRSGKSCLHFLPMTSVLVIA